MKKELEGFITADVFEYVLPYERTFNFSKFRYKRVIMVTFKIDDPRCTVSLIKDKDGQTLDAEYMKQLELDV